MAPWTLLRRLSTLHYAQKLSVSGRNFTHFIFLYDCSKEPIPMHPFLCFLRGFVTDQTGGWTTNQTLPLFLSAIQLGRPYAHIFISSTTASQPHPEYQKLKNTFGSEVKWSLLWSDRKAKNIILRS